MAGISRKDKPTDMVKYRGDKQKLEQSFCTRLDLYHLESHHAKFQLNRLREAIKKKKNTKFHKMSKKGGQGHLQCKLLVRKKFAIRGGSRG